MRHCISHFRISNQTAYSNKEQTHHILSLTFTLILNRNISVHGCSHHDVHLTVMYMIAQTVGPASLTRTSNIWLSWKDLVSASFPKVPVTGKRKEEKSQPYFLVTSPIDVWSTLPWIGPRARDWYPRVMSTAYPELSTDPKSYDFETSLVWIYGSKVGQRQILRGVIIC